MISNPTRRSHRKTHVFGGLVWALITVAYLSSGSIKAAEIHEAAKTGDLAKVKALIAKDPGLVAAADEAGRTALHWACRGVHVEIVKFLIDQGADVNARDARGVTPLHSVSSRGHVEAARMLIDQGARLDVKMSDQTTPLHLAAQNGHLQVMSLLLNGGAAIDVQDAYEGTPLHAAVFEKQSTVVELLADWITAKRPSVMNMVDYDGWTALHAACATGHLEIAKQLVSGGAGLNLRNTVGQTAYNLAEKEGFKEIAAFLAQQGADQGPQKFPRLTGPYLGQTPPGKTPRLFAKGIVSTRAGIYGTIVFSPGGDEAFWKPNVKDLSFIKRKDGVWEAPRVFPFKEKDTINVPFFSFDGRRLYFMAGSSSPEGMIEKESIWFVERNGQAWSEPRTFDPVVNSVPMHWQFSIDKKGNVYTSTDNIYCARYENGRYMAPEKLPPPINAVHTIKYREGEIGPFISPDGDYLVFTKFPVGLYVSFRNKDGSWTEPRSLSERLQTRGNDSMAKVSPDGKYLFFQSVRPGSTPNRSLYWVDAGIIEDLRPKTAQELE